MGEFVTECHGESLFITLRDRLADEQCNEGTEPLPPRLEGLHRGFREPGVFSVGLRKPLLDYRLVTVQD